MNDNEVMADGHALSGSDTRVAVPDPDKDGPTVNEAPPVDQVPSPVEETAVEETAVEYDDEERLMEFVGSKDVLGLDGLFNTFRVGIKWADLQVLEVLRLKVGEEVLDGPTVVLSVRLGGLVDMIELHSGLNHGCSQAMPADRKLELRRILQNVYGRPLSDHEPCVVVYMHRMSGADQED